MRGTACPPLSLRVSVTDRCSLRCAYCRPAAGRGDVEHLDLLSYEQMVRFVRLLNTRYGLSQVRLTGGEPLVRPHIEKLVEMLAAEGVPDLALTTNGQQLAELANPLKEAGLCRVNVSLDTLDPARFWAITRGGALRRTLAAIDAALHAGLDPVKLNMVVMRGINDDEVTGLVRFAIDHDCQMRFLELMPIGVAAADFENRFVSSAEVRGRLTSEFALDPLPVDPYDTSRNFAAVDDRGRSATVGFISPYSQPFCAGCWRLRLTAAGELMGCLARPERIPLAPLLHRGTEVDIQTICAAVEQALIVKRRNGEFVQPRTMVAIGG